MKPTPHPLAILFPATLLGGISASAQQDPPERKPPVIEQPLGEEKDPDEEPKPETNPPPAPPPVALPTKPTPPPAPPEPPKINLPLGLGEPGKPPSPDVRPSPPPRPMPAPPAAAPSPAPRPTSTVKLDEIIGQTKAQMESLAAPATPHAGATAESIQAIEDRIKGMQGSFDATEAANIQSVKEMGEELKRLQAERAARKAALRAEGKELNWVNFYHWDRDIQKLEKQIIAAVRQLQNLRKKRAEIGTMIDATKGQLETTGHLEDPSRGNRMEQAVRQLELEALQQQLHTLNEIKEERGGGGPGKPGPMEVAVGDSFYLASALGDALREINMLGAHDLPLSMADIKTFNGPLGEETPYDEPAENETPIEAQLRLARQQEEIARRALERAQAALHNARDSVAGSQELELARQERDLLLKAQIDFPDNPAKQQAEVKRQMISLRTRAILDRSRQTAELSKTLEADVKAATAAHQNAQAQVKRLEEHIRSNPR